MTADGDVVEADGELLWGLRGGGGNFGVVTRFDLALHPVGPTVVAGHAASYPLERLDEVLAAREALAAGPELAILLILRQAPPAPWIPRRGPRPPRGARSPSAVRGAASPLSRRTRARATPVASGPTWSGSASPTPPWAEGFHNYWKAQYLDRVDAGVLADFAARDHARRCRTSSSGSSIARRARHRRVREPRRAPAARTSTRAGRTATARRTIAWTRALWEALLPCSSGGVYVNFLGDEGADRVRAAYGEAQLRAARRRSKRRYDPENVFRVNQNISLG